MEGEVMKKKELSVMAWHLMKSYWQSEERWKARGLLSAVILLTFGQVYMMVLNNDWLKEFYNALQNFQIELFWPLIGQFVIIAVSFILMAVYATYLKQILDIKWRTWMTKKYMEAWLHNQTYYRLQLTSGADMDNPDQRISEDVDDFVTLTLDLFVGLLGQLTSLVAFGVILWQLSGDFDLALGDTIISVPGYMLWVTLIYSTVGTYLAHKIGKKLIGLNFDQQRYEADFRFSMMRMRENGESIAFYGGEAPELQGFQDRFGMVIKNFWSLIKRIKLLNFYSVGYGQAAAIIPLLMCAPRCFSGEMPLGALVQTTGAFGRVSEALSYFVDRYTELARYASIIARLGGFVQHMEAVEEIPSHMQFGQSEEKALVLRDVELILPDGKRLADGLSLAVPQGKYLLIGGGSGCGKSTLLRSLAGIWPYAKGSVAMPRGWRTMFLPQRPYLPLGTLRRAVYYPQPVPEVEAANLTELMAAFGIEQLYEKLDVVDDWSRILSLGEQQRLAFIRILLLKPDIVFLDESTSAMDEAREAESYELLKRLLPDMTVVSVGHRATLIKCHDKHLIMSKNTWELHDIA